MRVLIVEDTDSVRFAMRLAMEHLGHEVVGVATDGLDALQKYQAVRPDAVVMDVRMPRMDGLTCTQTLLRQYDPTAKIVIVTAGRTAQQEALGAGARAFVEKPFALSDLDQAMHKLQAA
jgi:two-component system chemotaxis response regulator CheY